jgi:hypothetical protein
MNNVSNKTDNKDDYKANCFTKINDKYFDLYPIDLNNG